MSCVVDCSRSSAIIRSLKFVKRHFILTLCLGLAACGDSVDRTATVRFKSILALDVNGQTKEFYSVMQVEYTRITKSLMGAGGAVTMWGEAVPIDLGKDRRAYMLVSTREKNGNFGSSYGGAFKQSFGIKKSLGSLRQKDIEALRSLSGRVPLKNTNYFDDVEITYYPMIIAFEDESDPKTVYEVSRNDLTGALGSGVKFKGIDLEITAEPITEGRIFEYLPWLKKKYKSGFERRPASWIGSITEMPAKWFINYNAFFAKESR